MNTAKTPQAAVAVAAQVRDAGRTRPLVVLTVAPGAVAPGFDVEEILAALGGRADVHVLASGEAVQAFAERVPTAPVYGGAARVYPPGGTWLDDPARLPVRFPADRHATAVLVDDALAMVARANWRSGRVSPGRRRTGEVKGLAAGRAVVRLDDGSFASITPALTAPGVPLERLVVVGQQVVGLHDGASPWLDVHDSLRASSQSLKPYKVGRVVLAQISRVEPERVLVRLHPDVEVAVRRQDAQRGNVDDAQWAALYSPGDVVRAVVTARPPAWALRLVDLPDGEPVRAAALLPGGPPWLVEAEVPSVAEQVERPRPVPVPVPAPPVRRSVGEATPPARPESAVPEAGRGEPAAKPVRATPGALVGRARTPLSATPVDMSPRSTGTPPQPGPPELAAPQPTAPKPTAPKPTAPKPTAPQPAASKAAAPRNEVVRLPQAGLKAPLRLGDDPRDANADAVDALLREFALVERERSRLQERVDLLTDQLREMRSQLRSALATPDVVEPLEFADQEMGLRHELLGAWARRIPAADQPQVRLGEYRVGPHFLSSLIRLGASHRDKALAVAVEVLCGLAPSIPGREVHRYRESESGGSPYVTRADGAGLWRANLQSGTAAARRLHYWILPGGMVELCHVGVHDERPPH